MPKTTKARTTKARAEPLQPKDANVTKKSAKPAARETSVKTGDAQSKVENVENYLLLVALQCTENPTITRTLSIRSDLTFATLHQALQITFGWAGCHAHGFRIHELPDKDSHLSHIGYDGPIVLSLSPNNDMGELMDDPDAYKKEEDYKLSDIYEGDKFKGKITVNYEYDFGDGWEHQIIFLGKEDGTVRQVLGVPEDLPAVCLSGEGHPCAEDCGGSEGWEGLKKVFRKGGRDPEDRKGWYKTTCANGDSKGLDPYKWDILDVNDELQQMKIR